MSAEREIGVLRSTLAIRQPSRRQAQCAPLDATSGVTGSIDNIGVRNLTPVSFTATATTAVSVTQIGSTLRVTHDYHPSTRTPNLYAVTVTIENISAAAVDARYRRTMDWDVEPTEFDEFVTVHKGASAAVLYDNNDGFAPADPLGPTFYANDVTTLVTGDFTDIGPDDQGALFDFGFGTLAPGASKVFTLYYGGAGTEQAALAALQAVGVDTYSLAQPNTADGPTLGQPQTFIFGFTEQATEAAPMLTVSPVSLAFQRQRVATPTLVPESLDVTVTNPGTVAVAISDIAITGTNAADFKQTTTCGSTLSPGAQCRVTVSFLPTPPPDPNTPLVINRAASLTITSNAQGSPHTVTLSGQTYQPTILYVHGILDPFRRGWFQDLLDPFVVKFGTNAIVRFEYYQDSEKKVASQSSPTGQVCLPHDRADPAQNPTAATDRYIRIAAGSGLPLDQRIPQSIPGLSNPSPPEIDLGVQGNYCDSQSDLGWNALVLRAEIQRLYARNGNQPIVLVANSMGGAITRGTLAYLVAQNDTATIAMIDSVVFIEGAQQGSYLGYLGPTLQQQQLKQTLASNGFALNPDRPAIPELTPGSNWYQWVNDPAAQRLPDLPYYNVYGDINLVRQVCIGRYCKNLGQYPLGDTVLLPGVNDPFAAPPEGGARFLLGSPQPTRWQWSLPDQVTTNIIDPRLFALPPTYVPNTVSVLRQIFNSTAALPEIHTRVGNLGVFNQIPAEDCYTRQPAASISAALESVIDWHLSSPAARTRPTPCRP